MPRKLKSHRKPGRPKGARNRKLNPKVAQAIELIEQAVDRGERVTITEIAAQVGMKREAISRAIHRDDIVARFNDKARKRLGGMAVLRAANRVSALIDAESEDLQFKASTHVLGIAGIKPKDTTNGGAGRVSVVFNLSHAQPQLVNVTPAMQIEQPESTDDGTE